MKRFIRAILIISGVWILGSCSNDDKTILKIGVLRTVDSVPLYLAYKEGFFEQAGADVELIEFGSASDQSKAMEAGELDGMMTDMVVQSLIQKGGTEMRTISGVLGKESSEGRFVLVSAPGSKIEEAGDLTGKRIAIPKGTMMEYLLDSYLEEAGIDKTKVVKEQIPKLSLRLDMVLEGKDIDAAILPDPLAFFAESKGAYTVIDDTKLEVNLSQSVLAFKKESLELKREEVKRCLKGYEEAVQQLNINPSKYEEYFKEAANIPAEVMKIYQIPSYTKGWVPEEKEVTALIKWMVDTGLLEEAYQYSEIVDDGFLER